MPRAAVCSLGANPQPRRALQHFTHADTLGACLASLSLAQIHPPPTRVPLFQTSLQPPHSHFDPARQLRPMCKPDADVRPESSDTGHGTHVAGIVAAVRNSVAAVAGAAPRVKVMVLKVGAQLRHDAAWRHGPHHVGWWSSLRHGMGSWAPVSLCCSALWNPLGPLRAPCEVPLLLPLMRKPATHARAYAHIFNLCTFHVP